MDGKIHKQTRYKMRQYRIEQDKIRQYKTRQDRIRQRCVALYCYNYSLMEQIQTVHGKLFLIVYELYKNRLITDRDRQYLKDMIIVEEPRVFRLVEAYLRNGTPLTLKNDVLQLVWAERSNSFCSGEVEAAQSVRSSSADRKRRMQGLQVKIPPKNIQKIEHRSV